MTIGKTNAVSVFRALADEHRLRMLEYVAYGKPEHEPQGDGICSCHVQAHVGLSQPTVSHHMKLLVEAGLVASEKRGKWVYYRLNPEGFALAQKVARGYLSAAPRSGRLQRRSASGA